MTISFLRVSCSILMICIFFTLTTVPTRPATQMNGDKTSKLETASDDGHLIRWINQSATPLITNQQHYGKLEHWFESAQVVGLGEATHGQHEAFELKRQLTMHLIRNHGYRVVAYEANASSATACNDFISGKTDDLKAAIGGLGMLIWQVEENVRLLDDLRRWNLQQPNDQVRFIGVDAQNGKAVLSKLVELLGDRNSEQIDQLKALQQRLGTAMKQALRGDGAALNELLADGRTICRAIKEMAPSQSLDEGEIAIRLKEFMANLSLYSAPGMRDKQMAELLLAQLPAAGKNKCVFWGHNGHVQRGELWLGTGMVPTMGGHLEKKLGDKYYAIGLIFGQGEFQANVRGDDNVWRFRRYRHSSAPPGSMGAVFATATQSDFILDFRSAPKSSEVTAWLKSEQAFRSWGGYNVPENFDDPTQCPLPRCVPAETFDGIVFHHRTTAANPLAADLVVSKQEDETKRRNK